VVERERNYLFEYTKDYVADAVRQGNKTRFMNHSLTPNVRGAVYLVNGVKRIGFFAIRDIPAQAEVRSIFDPPRALLHNSTFSL
jgi:SET domain-containing protein